jgi:serine/threonine protein kinase
MTSDLAIPGLEILEEIGRGGFGVVYRARQQALRRDVAVKVLSGTLDEAAQARFERECLAAGTLSGHPNVVSVYEVGKSTDNRPYIVMEYLGGGSLGALVREKTKLSPAEGCRLVTLLAGGLATAHEHGIVHRDVKPENVLLSSFGLPQLVDFGIAAVADAYETRSGTLSATLAYAAPEIVAGAAATAASDQYSLAALLFFTVAGHSPFAVAGEQSLVPLLARIAVAPVPDLRSTGVPEYLCNVIERGLSKEPHDRFPDVSAFADALQRAATACGWEQTQAVVSGERSTRDEPHRESGTPAPPRDRPRPKRRLVAAGIAGLAITSGAVATARSIAHDSGATSTVVSTSTSTSPSPTGATRSTSSVDSTAPSTTNTANPGSSISAEQTSSTSAVPSSVSASVVSSTVASRGSTAGPATPTTAATVPTTASTASPPPSTTLAPTTTARQRFVPPVVGKQAGAAQSAIAYQGLVMITVNVTPAGCTHNAVLTQSPAAGSPAGAGDAVTVTVCVS